MRAALLTSSTIPRPIRACSNEWPSHRAAPRPSVGQSSRTFVNSPPDIHRPMTSPWFASARYPHKTLACYRMSMPMSPRRIKIPFLVDLVTVSDPDQIRRIEATGDVDRLHVFDSASLPWWVRYFFRATKFHDDKRDLWFCPFESASNPTYPGRRAYLEQKVEE